MQTHQIAGTQRRVVVVALNKKRAGTSSRYKGVSWDGRQRKWRVDIRLNGRLVHVGRFATETDAALAYNKKMLEAWNVHLNSVEKPPEFRSTLLDSRPVDDICPCPDDGQGHCNERGEQTA
jgi:hypothetical protein